MDYKAGDIVLIHHNKGWLSALIRTITHCDYNHTGIFVSEDEIIEATFKGVYRSSLSKFILGEDKKELRFIVKRLNGLTVEDTAVIVAIANGMVGKGYDMPKLFGLLILFFFHMSRKKWSLVDLKDAWVCSELVSDCYFSAGYNLFASVDYENLTPADIFNSSLLTEVV